MRSGNLNFTIPLLKVNGRGWSVPFSLSYNSQNWREDGTTDWNLGRDVGFGYGWKLQGGSLTPYYSGYWTLDHYLFRDATGAEYRLDVNTGGVWTSKEPGLYLEYDTTVATGPRLYFPDGTFWVFGCTAAGTEQDAGTMYPTLMQDSNGNQVNLTFAAGVNVTWTNSSGRMGHIADVNGTYDFTYNTDAIPHLTAISSSYPGASYTFNYAGSTPLASPISGTSFGTASFLWYVTNTSTLQQTTFYYNWTPNGAGCPGELTQAIFPYGGYIRWNYSTTSYTTSRSQREVSSRNLAMSSGATELTYPISYAGTQFHTSATVTDAAGLGQKQWYFSSVSDASLGLQNLYLENSRTSTANAFSTVAQTGYTWTSDALSRPYISTVTSTLDGIAQKKTTQQMDQYGNVASMNLLGLST